MQNKGRKTWPNIKNKSSQTIQELIPLQKKIDFRTPFEVSITSSSRQLMKAQSLTCSITSESVETHTRFFSSYLAFSVEVYKIPRKIFVQSMVRRAEFLFVQLSQGKSTQRKCKISVHK